MDHFTEALQMRVTAAEAAIVAAAAAGDDHAVAVRMGEIESLRRLAEDNGVVWADLDGERWSGPDSLTA